MSTRAEQHDPGVSAQESSPATATNPALLVDGSDLALRHLVYDLFTIGERLTEVRRYLGAQLGLSGPQFNLLTAIRQLQGDVGVSVGEVAEFLHVSGPFVASESAKLVAKGLVGKSVDPEDARVTRLRLSQAGNSAAVEVIPEMQAINDVLFDVRDGADFEAMRLCIERLSEGAAKAVAYTRSTSEAAKLRSSIRSGSPSARNERTR